MMRAKKKKDVFANSSHNRQQDRCQAYKKPLIHHYKITMIQLGWVCRLAPY